VVVVVYRGCQGDAGAAGTCSRGDHVCVAGEGVRLRR